MEFIQGFESSRVNDVYHMFALSTVTENDNDFSDNGEKDTL